MFGPLNINSIGEKNDSQVTIANKNVDVFLISETKILTAQYLIEGYTTPFRIRQI